MAVGIHSKTKTFTIGAGAFLGAFFDTVEVRLTKGIWGKKFPVILGELYQGQLNFAHLEQAEAELKKIQKLLKKHAPDKIVWDKTDLKKQPPWGDNISTQITDLSNYFVTSDGKDLFAVLFSAIAYAREEKSDLSIR